MAHGQGLSIGKKRAELSPLFERGSIMHVRVILCGVIISVFAADATAQGRVRWRPGSILGGLRSRVQGARQDPGEQQPTLAPVERAADGPRSEAYRNIPSQPARIYPAEPPLSPPPRPSRPLGQPLEQGNRAVTVDEVIELVQRGLGESTIVQHIDVNGVRQHLEVGDLIRLHEAGAAEPIIHAMQTAKVFPAAPSRNRGKPLAGSYPAELGPRFPEPPRRPVNINRPVSGDGFGPSILEPPSRPTLSTPLGRNSPVE